MKKFRILALCLALTMCLALAACGQKKEPVNNDQNNTGDTEVATLNLGFIGPMTGPAALYGQTAKQGAEIAAKEISEMEGGKIKINLMPMDDEHDGEKATYAYQQLKDKGAQAIIGCVTTAPCNTVAPEAFADRMFMLTPSATSPTVTEGRDNMYQLCFSDPTMGNESAQFIKDKALATKIALLYDNSDAYSSGIATAFKAKATELGLNLVSETTFTDGATDFSVQLRAAKDAGADLIFMPIYYTPASLIIKQAADMSYAPKFFGCDGMDGILGIEGFDKKMAEGVMLLTPFNADAEDAATKSFVEKYKAAYKGEVPSQFAADGYDCVYAIYNACLAAEADVAKLSYTDMCELLIKTFSSESFTFTGLTGKQMTWDKTGEVSKNSTVYVIKDGVYAAM